MKFIYTLLLSILFANIGQAQISKNMELLAHWDADTFPFVFSGQYSDCWGITAPNGKEYAVIGSTPYIHFFDITDVNNLQEVAHFAGGTNSLWREFKSYKDHVYAVADQGQEGLLIFDCKNAPNIVKTKQTTKFSSRTHMPFIDEKNGRLYLTGTDTQNGGLIILDLTEDPDNPKLLASVALPGGYVHDIHVKDNIAYCSHGNNGLWVYDFTDPNNPILLGNMTSYPESGYNHSTWLTKDDKYLIQCDETHNTSVKTVDIQDLSDIKVVDLFKSTLLAPAHTNSIGHNPYVRGDYSLISYYHDGLQVYDVSNPLDVKNVAWYDTEPNNTTYDNYDGLWGVYPFFESDKLVLSDLNNGLFITKLTKIDLDSIHTTGLPDPTMNVAGDVKICQGESITLSIPSGAQFINWYKDGKMVQSSGNEYVASKAGIYKAVTWTHANIKESSIVKISFSTLKAPTIVADNAAIGVCVGDTLQICSDATSNNVIWTSDLVQIDQGKMCIDVLSGGNYKQIATDGMCVKASNELNIEQYASPNKVLTPDSGIICPQDSITLQADQTATTWQWYLDGNIIPGSTQSSFVAKIGGNYSVFIENPHCSILTNEAPIILSTLITPEISQSQDTLVSTKAFSYKWFLNGNIIVLGNSKNFIPNVSGTYTVITSDVNGCEAESNPYVFIKTSIADLNLNGFKISPNPVTNWLQLQLAVHTNFTSWSIINSNGLRVLNGNIANKDQININVIDLPAGFYILECKGDGSHYEKFIKQ